MIILSKSRNGRQGAGFEWRFPEARGRLQVQCKLLRPRPEAGYSLDFVQYDTAKINTPEAKTLAYFANHRLHVIFGKK